MLSDWNTHTMIPVADLERARRFYEEKLGFEPGREMPGLRFYNSGGSEFAIYVTEFTGTGKQTVMGWETQDLDREMEHLRSRGIAFEEYDMPDLKTVNGIATVPGGRSAWFVDTEGNTLAIFQAD
jgi:catechol 2,3-dioxygenase-like lactoylglutathione lyase family enzyme